MDLLEITYNELDSTPKTEIEKRNKLKTEIQGLRCRLNEEFKKAAKK